MREPFHEELHKILISKGFEYQKYDTLFDIPCDRYVTDDITLIFYEDESITTIGPDGGELSMSEFDRITNHIFVPERN